MFHTEHMIILIYHFKCFIFKPFPAVNSQMCLSLPRKNILLILLMWRWQKKPALGFILTLFSAFSSFRAKSTFQSWLLNVKVHRCRCDEIAFFFVEAAVTARYCLVVSETLTCHMWCNHGTGAGVNRWSRPGREATVSRVMSCVNDTICWCFCFYCRNHQFKLHKERNHYRTQVAPPARLKYTDHCSFASQTEVVVKDESHVCLTLCSADNTASILTKRGGFRRREQAVYRLPVLIVDSGSPALSSTNTLSVRVCDCDSDGVAMSCGAVAYTATGLSTGALLAILACIITLLGKIHMTSVSM